MVTSYDYAFTAAAIMFSWMDDRAAYDNLYETRKDDLGGFRGIQDQAAQAAMIFMQATEAVDPHSFDWINATDLFAFWIMKRLTEREDTSHAAALKLAGEAIASYNLAEAG